MKKTALPALFLLAMTLPLWLAGCEEKKQYEPPVDLKLDELADQYEGKRVALKGYLRFQETVGVFYENGARTCEILLKPQPYNKETHASEDSPKIVLKVMVGENQGTLQIPEMNYTQASLKFRTADKIVGVNDLVRITGLVRYILHDPDKKVTSATIDVESVAALDEPPATENSNVPVTPPVRPNTSKKRRGSR